MRSGGIEAGWPTDKAPPGGGELTNGRLNDLRLTG